MSHRSMHLQIGATTLRDLRIETASPGDCLEALSMLFSDLETSERTQRLETLLVGAGLSGASLEGLVVAKRGACLVGAAMSLVHPGRSAMVWPPRVVAGEPPVTAAALLERICDQLAEQPVRIAQCLLGAHDEADAELLVQADFEPFAELLFLAAAPVEFPTRPPASGVTFEPFDHSQHGRLARLVERTYQGTLDCPRLNGISSAEDTLAGYRATGEHDADLWLFVRHGDEDVGCLLLADHPAQGNLELVYMGIVPESRGHSWGVEIARHAQWLARKRGRNHLVLAVDAENEPALRMYGRSGFHAWDRRIVYVKVFGASR